MTGLSQEVRAATERWVEETIIAYAFCPFAAAPWADGDVLLEALPPEREAALTTVYRRASQMRDRPLPETTLLTAPEGLSSLGAFLEFQAAAEELLEVDFAACSSRRASIPIIGSQTYRQTLPCTPSTARPIPSYSSCARRR